MSRLKTINAILMITGTSVGTGILGLPIVTSSAGLLPTLFAFVASWLFMTAAALHILEIKMQVKGHYNLSSMIKLTLGRTGQYSSSIIILLLLYALLCTYVMAGSAWFNVLFSRWIGLPMSLVTIVFTTIFASVIFLGDRFIYKINNLLAVCLTISFMLTIGLSLSPIHQDFITRCDFSLIIPSFPLLLTTFGFSIVVPAVTEYLDYDSHATKFSILAGGLIAFVAYAVWEWIILTHVPFQGPMSIDSIRQSGDNGTGVILAFAAVKNSHWVTLFGRLFAVFAAITSFLGVSLALIHFLADSIKMPAVGSKRLILALITFIPPLLITHFAPNAFVQVLSFAGIFVAILLGLFPVLMVLKTKLQTESLLQKIGLMCTGLFFIAVIVQEVVNLV